MLVLSRRRNERIMIGDDIIVTIVETRGDKVRVGVTAPKEIAVHREEVWKAIQEAKQGILETFVPFPPLDDAEPESVV